MLQSAVVSQLDVGMTVFMKILFYINTIQRGGAERVMCNLANRFSEQGNACVLVTSFFANNEYDLSEKVKRIALFLQKPAHGFVKRNYLLVKRLRNVLRQEHPDMLISFMAEPNFRAIIASAGLKNKVVVSVRNDPNTEYKTFVTKMLAKLLFRFADGVVFQTEEAQKWFSKYVQKKSAIIFNQVDKEFYDTKCERERHDVVTTGRLVPQKNHKLLIRAFADIADKVSDNLIIYGEGELRSELKEMISELHMENRVFLPGTIENVAETIIAAKLFVLSSDYEGMPNSLMEAMALGLPCVSTDCPCGGPRELFGEYGEGRLVACGDASALAATIQQKLEHQEDGATERMLARRFAPDDVNRRWAAYITAIVEKDKQALS